MSFCVGRTILYPLFVGGVLHPGEWFCELMLYKPQSDRSYVKLRTVRTLTKKCYIKIIRR